MFEKLKLAMMAYYAKYDERMLKTLLKCKTKKHIKYCKDCKDYKECFIKKYEVS